MTDTEGRVRSALDVLARAEDVTIPPLDSVIDSVIGRTPRVAPRHRSRTLIAAGLVGAVVVGGTALGATGRLPISVDQSFHRINDWGVCRLDVSTGRMLASLRFSDGKTIQWWRATGVHAVGDQVRVVDRDGTAHDLNWSRICDNSVDVPSRRLYEGRTFAGFVSTDEAFMGQAPSGTVAVRATYADGSTADWPLQPEQFFMGPANASPGSESELARVDALGADGSVIESAVGPNFNPA